jgi:sialate O-acetylesterase
VLLCLAGLARGADMPQEDVVDVPAIGKGLCVSNAFQSNMVLQRDKPLAIWGGADPEEDVAVAFAGQEARAKARTDPKRRPNPKSKE